VGICGHHLQIAEVGVGAELVAVDFRSAVA
jgi:hypothetical protein